MKKYIFIILIFICILAAASNALDPNNLKIDGDGLIQFKGWDPLCIGIPGITTDNSVSSNRDLEHHAAYLVNLNFSYLKDNLESKLTLLAENSSLCNTYTQSSSLKSKMLVKYYNDNINFYVLTADLGMVMAGKGLMMKNFYAEGTRFNFKHNNLTYDLKWLGAGYTGAEDVIMNRLELGNVGCTLFNLPFIASSTSDPLNNMRESALTVDFTIPFLKACSFYNETGINRFIGSNIGTSAVRGAYLVGLNLAGPDQLFNLNFEYRKYASHFNEYIYYATNEASFTPTPDRLTAPYSGLETDGKSINDWVNYASFDINEVTGCYTDLQVTKEVNSFVKFVANLENLSLLAPGKAKTYFVDRFGFVFQATPDAEFHLLLSNWRQTLTDTTMRHYLLLRGTYRF